AYDLAALAEDALGALHAYVNAPDPAAPGSQAARQRYRQRIIAETIEQLYEGCFCGTQARDSACTELEALVEQRLQAWRANPLNRGSVEPSRASLRRDILTDPATNPGVEGLLRHVDERGRRAFLYRYEEEVRRLQARLDAVRADRIAWLRTAEQPD